MIYPANFSKPYLQAKHSRSPIGQARSRSESRRDAYAIAAGRSTPSGPWRICHSTAPTPRSDASTEMLNGKVKSGCISTGASCTATFNSSKALSCSGPQCQPRFFAAVDSRSVSGAHVLLASASHPLTNAKLPSRLFKALKFSGFNVTEPGSLGVWALFCTALVLKNNAAHRESNTGILPKGVAHCAMAPGQAFPVDFSSI